MRTVSIAMQLEDRRIEVDNDYQFVMRCQDGKYGSLASQVAIDVIAWKRSRATRPGDACPVFPPTP